MLLLALLFGGVTVTLSPQAKVRGTEIALGSIAAVSGDDAALVARVRELRLGYAPAPGYSRLLAGELLQAELTRTLPGTAVELKGAAACRVLPATEVVGGRAIEAAAKGELLRRLDGRDVELSLS